MTLSVSMEVVNRYTHVCQVCSFRRVLPLSLDSRQMYHWLKHSIRLSDMCLWI